MLKSILQIACGSTYSVSVSIIVKVFEFVIEKAQRANDGIIP
jgi:hypothetical protein